MNIRKMTSGDTDAVIEICALAFLGYYGKLFERTPENIASSLDLYPDGCFIYEDEKGVCGFIFSRCLGKTGWIGVFGIHPCRHGKNIGKKLLAAAYESLENAECETIGLETMSDSPYNIGLYLKEGFELTYPVIVLEKNLQGPVVIDDSCLRDDFTTEEIKDISSRVIKGLDFTPEVENAKKYGWGKTFVFKGLSSRGFTILRHVSIIKKQKPDSLTVRAFVMEKENMDDLGRAMAEIENFALDSGLKKVTIAASAVNKKTVNRLLGLGYLVQRSAMRMLKKESPDKLNGIELSRWIM